MLVQFYHGTLTRRHIEAQAGMAFLSITLPALFLSAYHSLFCVISVLLLKCSLADWPPLFGNIFDAWSVGRWYSRFWEKLMRKAFTIDASSLVLHFFRLRPGCTAGRAWIIMLSFTMDRIMHTFPGWTGGACATSTPMWTYLATGAVILVERGIHTFYARYLHSRSGLGWKWQWWEILGWRLVGYCWVVIWWREVIPWAIRPVMRCHSLSIH